MSLAPHGLHRRPSIEGPFYHQWIRSITVNGKLLDIDRTARPYPKHAQTSDIPCEVVDGEGSKVVIQFCSNQESSDPGKESNNQVNVRGMRGVFKICKQEIGVWYSPKSKENVVNSSTSIDSRNLRVTLTAARFDGGMVHSIYTTGLGPGHLWGEATDAISFRSSFRNPDCWSFNVQATPQIPQHELANDLKAIFHSGSLSDVQIVVEGERIQAHSVILAARSSVFAAMFKSQMQESREKIVNVGDVPASAMQALLSFLYSGEAPLEVLKGMWSCLDLLRAAHRYDVTSLVAKCSQSLEDLLSVETVCDCFSTAEALHLERLRTKCFEFMQANISDLQTESSYIRLTDQTPSLLRELMTALHPPRKRARLIN